MKKALIIGIDYIGQDNELGGCINDAENIFGLLLRLGFDVKNIRILTDKNEVKPTRKNIFKMLKWLRRDAKKDSILFFHYSGHGGQQKDKNGDEKDGKDEMIYPLDWEKKGGIKDDEIRDEFIEKVSDGYLFGILDCCNSGTTFDLRYNFTSTDKEEFKMEKHEKYARTEASVFILSACRDDEQAEESGGEGVLTRSFLQVLKEHEDYMLSYTDLLQGVRNKMKSRSQHPCLSVGHSSDISGHIEF